MAEQLTGHQETRNTELKKWEEVQLNGEDFLVMRDLKAPLLPVKDSDQPPVVFTYDEYRHKESGTQIQVWKLGMDTPVDKPAVIRLDYSCPCMNIGSTMHLMGHDCAQQRDMMFQTIADVGVGAVAIVTEQTAAGNGHGSHAVLQQSTIQYNALKQGQQMPTMQQTYIEMGYFDDLRQHTLVASTLANSVGTERPAIAVTSNAEKLMQLKTAGLNVISDARIELVTDLSGQSAELTKRRRSGNYYPANLQQPGAYLVLGSSQNTPSMRLTHETYESFLTPLSIAKPLHRTPRRIIN